MPQGHGNVETAARAIVDIFATGDVSAISAAVAEEYVDHQGLGGGEIRGRDGFRQVVEAVRRHSGEAVTIAHIVAAGDKAALRLRWVSTDASGRTSTRETLDLLRFADGRLAEHWGAESSRSADEASLDSVRRRS